MDTIFVKNVKEGSSAQLSGLTRGLYLAFCAYDIFLYFSYNLLISSCLTNYLLFILGDRIVSVNGDSVTGRSYAEVVQLIQCTKGYLRLLVVPRQDDILQMVS